MKIIKTEIEGVYIIEPKVFKDSRGYFYESWNQDAFEKAGLKYNWVQDNQSKSVYGTVRGIHYQKGEDAQAKLVRALKGKVLDVAVDLREGSPTFGKHVAVELTEDNHRQLLIPRGLGHGFSVLSDEAVFAYKCDNGYAPQSEGSIRFNDSQLAIDWQIDADKVLLSDKDTKAPSFEQYTQTPDFKYSELKKD